MASDPPLAEHSLPGLEPLRARVSEQAKQERQQLSQPEPELAPRQQPVPEHYDQKTPGQPMSRLDLSGTADCL
ncbi:hypothetical protein [Nisaea denitrificans]|uniref:hypothetical protein n=1 Tax=Nisaea denitrificans TaxID=390877 RepID=UPI00056AC67C|nr:hypothetical protein [Nisaea denitrificans]